MQAAITFLLCRQRFLYWTDNMAGKIMRANLDGSGVSTVIEEGLMEPGS